MTFPEDYTGTFGEIPEQRAAMDEVFGPPDCPMYEYGRAASIFWNAFANTLIARGMSEAEAFAQMQSKGIRLMFDGELCEVLEAAAVAMARQYQPMDLTR